MKLKKVVLDEKAIRVSNEMKLESTGDMNNTRIAHDSYHEAPEPEFSKAVQALVPVVLSVLEMPKDWKAGLEIKGFQIRETKRGTRSVAIDLHKKLEEKNNEWKFPTPWFRIDKPQEGETGELQVTAGQAAKVCEAIHQVERYRDGHRSQQLLFDPAVTKKEGGKDELGLEE